MNDSEFADFLEMSTENKDENKDQEKRKHSWYNLIIF